MREGDHLGGIAEILIGPEAEQPSAAVVAGMFHRHEARQIALALDRCNFVEHRFQRSRAQAFDARFVHAGCEVIADLLLHGRAIGDGFRSLLQHSPKKLTVLLGQLSVHAPRGLVAGNRIALHPSAAGVLIKIDAWIGGAIHGWNVQARRVRERRQRALFRSCRQGLRGLLGRGRGLRFFRRRFGLLRGTRLLRGRLGQDRGGSKQDNGEHSSHGPRVYNQPFPKRRGHG